jgi:hypothetical protein
MYVGPIFESKLATFGLIDNEFFEYLAGRFGYSGSTGCPGAGFTRAQAESSRAMFEAAQRKAGSNVMEIDWQYAGDDPTIQVLQRPGQTPRAPVSPQPDHGYCFSQAFDKPQYASAVFDAVAPVNMSQWTAAFKSHLGSKYGYASAVYCNTSSLSAGQRLVKARLDGARAAPRSAVDTGWKFDLAAVSAAAPPAAAATPAPAPRVSAATTAAPPAQQAAPKPPKPQPGEKPATKTLYMACFAELQSSHTAYFSSTFESTDPNEPKTEFHKMVASTYGPVSGQFGCIRKPSVDEVDQQVQHWKSSVQAKDRIVDTGWKP